MKLEMLRESLENATVIKRGEYDYFVHPLTDGIERIEPELLREVARAIDELSGREYDRIVTIEAMGLPVATALSLLVDKPYTIIRKRRYGLEGEVEVVQRTGYSENRLYVNGLKKGDRILLLDVVISTGGTLRSVISALNGIDCTITDVVAVIEKNGETKEKLETEFGIKIKTLVKIGIEKGKVRIL
jgi:adenine phosphoribosyltransferase